MTWAGKVSGSDSRTGTSGSVTGSDAAGNTHALGTSKSVDVDVSDVKDPKAMDLDYELECVVTPSIEIMETTKEQVLSLEEIRERALALVANEQVTIDEWVVFYT